MKQQFLRLVAAMSLALSLGVFLLTLVLCLLRGGPAVPLLVLLAAFLLFAIWLGPPSGGGPFKEGGLTVAP